MGPFERDFLKIAKIISHPKNHAVLIKKLVTAKHMTKCKNKLPQKFPAVSLWGVSKAVTQSTVRVSTECSELLILAPDETVYRI